MKIALVRNMHSKYSVINQMEKDLIASWNRVSSTFKEPVEMVSYTLDEPGYTALYQACQQQEILCTFSINMTLGSALLYDIFSVPHVLFSLDALFWHEERDLLASHVLCCCTHPDSICSKTENRSFYVPHACSLAHIPYQAERKKTVPFFFPASYLDDEKEYTLWKKRWGEAIAQSLVDDAHSLLSDYSSCYFESLQQIYFQRIVPLVGEDTQESREHFFRSFDVFIRGCDRQALLKSLGSETIHIATDSISFERYQKRLPQVNFVYEGERSFEEIIPLFSKATCVLNSVPTNRFGLHERALYALACGAQLYSTTITSLPIWLRESKIVSFYDQKDPFTPCCTSDLFYDVWKWIEKEHTWDVRVKTLFPYIIEQSRVKMDEGRSRDPFSRFTF